MHIKRSIPLLTAILIALVFNACTWLANDDPCAKHIDQRTMANVLTDVFLLEAQITNQHPDSGIRDSIAHYYAGIFDKYDITVQEFEDAYACYMLDQENMTWIMDEVLSAISIAQSKIDEKKEESN